MIWQWIKCFFGKHGPWRVRGDALLKRDSAEILWVKTTCKHCGKEKNNMPLWWNWYTHWS